MIWLIGGTARCGKSTLARKAQSILGSSAVPLDFLLRALISVATEANQVSLCLSPTIDQYSIPEWLEAVRERDRVLWQATKALIEAALTSKSDLVLEGGLWPDYVAELAADRNVRTVFLIDTSSTHAKRIIQLAHDKTTQNNWMSEWSDEKLEKWAEYNVTRSQMIYDLATEHQQLVFDVAVDGLDGTQRKALDCLTKTK